VVLEDLHHVCVEHVGPRDNELDEPYDQVASGLNLKKLIVKLGCRRAPKRGRSSTTIGQMFLP